MGSVRRSSSRRPRSHRTLSEETAGEAAEEKLDPVDEAGVHLSENNFSLWGWETLIPSFCPAASYIPLAGPPPAGYTLLPSSQHQEGKSEQHLQLLPRSQQLRGRLWR